MRTSRRYQVRVPVPLAAELETFASQHGLGLGPAIRLLVGRGLQSEAHGGPATGGLPDSPAALAALTAAEHAVLMVASVLPEGQRRMRELSPAAAIAAEVRLALFRESGQ